MILLILLFLTFNWWWRLLRLIILKLTPLHLFVVLGHVVGTDGTEEANVVVRVELGHLLGGGLVRPVDLHFAVQPVVEQQVVGHAYAVRLHGVALAIVVVADVAWKKEG